jgi:hypothetical protein
LGLGFTKQSIVGDGGAPVWYVEKDTTLASALAGLQQSLTTSDQRLDWHRITPFIDKVGEFPDGTVYRFEWEREWRVPRRLDLCAGCPAFLFAPRAEHIQLVGDLTTRGVAGTPHGIAPLLDLSRSHMGRTHIAGGSGQARPVSRCKLVLCGRLPGGARVSKVPA